MPQYKIASQSLTNMECIIKMTTTKNFCKALRAHNTQNNDKVVKIHPFTKDLNLCIMQRCKEITLSAGHVTLENCS